MAASAGPALERLHREVGDRIAFLTIYVREAHPGERIPQPRRMEEKLANARAYQLRDAIPWTVAVDDLDGTVHRRLGRLPDAAIFVAGDGTIAYRALWSNDVAGLERGVAAVLGAAVRRRNRVATVRPLLRGLGMTHEILELAGRTAVRDMLKTAPPFHAIARLAGAFRPLRPLQRSIAAILLLGFAGIALGVASARARAATRRS